MPKDKKTAEEKILETITSEWQSTNQISQKSGVNWYRTDSILNNLYFVGKVDRDKKPDTVYWKVNKNG